MSARPVALLARAVARDVPVLAVCRGLQLLDVLRGGTLHQHLPDVAGSDRHGPAPGVYGDNAVRVAAGSRLAGLVGESAAWACHHHQAVDRLGEGLTAVAWADDGTVEAAELDGARFVVGVQGHPEVGEDQRPGRRGRPGVGLRPGPTGCRTNGGHGPQLVVFLRRVTAVPLAERDRFDVEWAPGTAVPACRVPTGRAGDVRPRGPHGA